MSILGRGRPWHEHANAREQARTPRWAAHVDAPWWGEGKEFGAPTRFYMWTPWGHFQLALTSGSRFVSSWNPVTQYYDSEGTYWAVWTPR